MTAAIHLTFLLCFNLVKHHQACEATSRATYQLNPSLYQPIDNLETNIQKQITPAFSLAFSIISAYHNKQIYIQLYNKEF